MSKPCIFPFCRNSLGIGIAVALLALSGLSSAQSSPETKSDPAWTAFLWQDGDLPLDPESGAALRALGIAGVNVAGTASSQAPVGAGLTFYVDHLAGKGDLFLRDEDWETTRRAYLKARDPRHLVRPRSLASEQVQARMHTRMDQVLAALGSRRARALSLDDEISLQRRGNAFDFDRSPALIDAWRNALIDRRPLNELRSRWRSALIPDDPGALVPPTTDGVRRRELSSGLGRWNLGDWNDWRRYQDRHFVSTIAALAERARKARPETPIGFTGGGAPNPFSGLDWRRLTESCDFFEPYDEAGTREMLASFARPGTVFFRTIFPDREHPRRTRQEVWEYALRGDDGAILWSSRGFFPEDDVKRPAPFVATLAPTFRELGSDRLAPFLRAERVPARIAILSSRASMRAHWMLDSQRDGGSWIERSGSWEVTTSSFNRTREAWQKLLEDLHLPYRFLDSRDIAEGVPEGIDALILPRTIALSSAERAAITAFARRKLVIADCQLGLLDEELIAQPIPPLDLVFGVHRENRHVALKGARPDASRDPARPGLVFAEPGLRVRRARGASARAFVGLSVRDVPALVEVRSDDGGLAVYLNLLVLDYLGPSAKEGKRDDAGPRARPTARNDLREHLRALMRRRGILPPVRVEGARDFPVLVTARRNGDRNFVALHANPRTSTVPSLDIDDAKPARLRLWFDRTVVVRDLRAPSKSKTKPRTARWHHDITLAPDEPVILEWHEVNVRNR